MLMEMFMKVIGKMIKHTEKGSILIWMEQFTKVNGKMINNMVKVLKIGQMVLNLKVHIIWEKNKEWVTLSGLMGLFLEESSKIITFMGKELMNGQMVEDIKEIGLIIKCMEKENLRGQMVEDM